MSSRLLRVALALAVLALLFGVGVRDHALWSPTEPAVAGVVRELLDHGDPAVPRIDGHPYLEKPPLYYLLAAGCCRVAGETRDDLIRLPAAVAGLACVAVVWWAGRRLFGADVAAVLALVAATSLPFLEIAHRASTDVLALLFACASWALFAVSLRAPSRRLDLAFACVAALAFHAKNFFTAFVVLPPVLASLALRGERRRLATVLVTFAAVTLLSVGPWIAALYRSGGADAVRVVLADNTIGRFFDLRDRPLVNHELLNDAWSAEKDKPLWYYAAPIACLMAPWLIVQACATWRLARTPDADPLLRFVRLALVLVPCALTLSSSRVAEYVLPLQFPLLLALGAQLAALSDADRRAWRANVALTCTLIAAGACVVSSSAPALSLTLCACLAGAWVACTGAWSFARLQVSLCLCAFALCGALAAYFPYKDQTRAYRPFFEAVRLELAGRPVVSTFHDDIRLPLITYYLGTRCELAFTPEDAHRALAAGAALITCPHWLKTNAWAMRLPIQILRVDRGKSESFVCVTAAPPPIADLD